MTFPRKLVAISAGGGYSSNFDDRFAYQLLRASIRVSFWLHPIQACSSPSFGSQLAHSHSNPITAVLYPDLGNCLVRNGFCDEKCVLQWSIFVQKNFGGETGIFLGGPLRGLDKTLHHSVAWDWVMMHLSREATFGSKI